MSKQKKANLEDLVKKVREGRSLSKEEIELLHSILRKAKEEKEAKKDEKESLSEVIERTMKIALAEQTLEQAKKNYFKNLPLSEKTKILQGKVDELEAFYEKKTPKLKAEAERLKKEREEREFYENYFKKYGYEL
ncbi:hypothetical protein CG478_000950 [Bacillus cytotoxicus]|uniref:hypothetical protein n=1 Tax=Bacillus cytotoxicus TaxID=580165 RepID=UPI000B9675DF|nr:hypothetical protein [Bacillus cytotoxicus]AWC27141.1 hypothetical protein CG483_000950 [Bacillus cytotoxicus]AWC39255.1 hypothetical protein CG480_000950 [Bacillus cytotoxicus]AWC47186.1 hypothetical protein CG478_000950 [Bacillus cytotoxicus]AWC51207.1 hypothetical protein CG477_000950 [Bacillus cytotoxicus]AWC55336.1 hypothetical protein CG476_000950 [Bacillus cytotoxicus]